MGINSNLHLVMFHIWTLNVLKEKRKLKMHTQLHYSNIDCSLRIVQSSSEIPWGRGVPKTISFIQSLALANHFPLCLKFSRRNLHFIEGLHLKAYAVFIPDLNLATTDPTVIFHLRKYGTPDCQPSNSASLQDENHKLGSTSSRHKNSLALCIKIHKHVRVTLA